MSGAARTATAQNETDRAASGIGTRTALGISGSSNRHDKRGNPRPLQQDFSPQAAVPGHGARHTGLRLAGDLQIAVSQVQEAHELILERRTGLVITERNVLASIDNA